MTGGSIPASPRRSVYLMDKYWAISTGRRDAARLRLVSSSSRASADVRHRGQPRRGCTVNRPDRAAQKIVIALNPDAQIIETDHGWVAQDRILGTGLLKFETAHEHPLWAKELYGLADHVPETEKYGVPSFLYRPAGLSIPMRFRTC